MQIIKRLIVLSILIGLGFTAWDYFDDDSVNVTYRTDAINRGDIREEITASGSLNPRKTVTVGSQVSGLITSVKVQVNDQVEEGQLLIEVDPALLLSQIKQDETNLASVKRNYDQAKRDLERTRTLAKNDFIPKADLEHAEQGFTGVQYSYDAAKITLERDNLNLSYTRISAPISGTIIALGVTEGQTLQSNYQAPNLLTIAADLKSMKIDISIPEADIQKVKPGMRTVFTVNAFPGKEFQGTVDSVNMTPSRSESGVQYGIDILAENPDLKLLPGMTANVGIVLNEKKDVLRIPSSALRFSPPAQEVKGAKKLIQYLTGGQGKTQSSAQGKVIYVLRDNVAVPVHVQTGISDDTYIEVTGEEIKEGDTVITGVKRARKR